MEETELDAKARRASILKLKSKSPGGPSLDVTLATKRRVSFSSRNRVKPFAADQDENTIWDNTYEEQADQTDSNRSSIDALSTHPDKSRNQLEFQIWESLDTTMRGNMEMELTCSTKFAEPLASIIKTRSQSMETTNHLLTHNTMRQETILNQSVMDFTIVSPASMNPEIMAHYMTVNQSSTMEFTCQQSDGMQVSMDITKGLSGLDNEYCKQKSLTEIPNQREINPEDTICNTVTMELTGVVPDVSDAFVVPKITPQRDIILRDTSFNDSATMDFTKTIPFIPQTIQLEDPPAFPKVPSTESNCHLNVVSHVSTNIKKSFENNVSDGTQIQPKTSLFTYCSQRSTEGSDLPPKIPKMDTSVVQANTPALNNTASGISIPSAKHSFVKTIPEGMNKIINALSDDDNMSVSVSKNIYLEAQEEAFANNQPPRAKTGILIDKTIPESTSDMLKIQGSVQSPISRESENKVSNVSSNEMDLSVYPSRNTTSKGQNVSFAKKHASDSLSDKFPTCQEPASQLCKPNSSALHYTASSITISSAKLSYCEEADSQLSKPKKGILVKKKTPESTSDMSKITSSDKMDISAGVSRNISVKDEADSYAKKHASDSLSDKFSTTYTIAKKRNSGKTFVVESNSSLDKENVYPLEVDKNVKMLPVKSAVICEKENINPLLAITGDVNEKENIKPPVFTCLAATNEKQHDITAGIDKENIKPLISSSENTDELKSILRTSCALNDVEQDKQSFHEECMIQNENDEPLPEGPHVSQEDIQSRELAFASEGDISGLLQNDLSAEMFMPSQQLNEDNAYNPSNVLYSEKIKPPELSSPENSAVISTVSFAYNNSELDTDQLIHAAFPQPDEISRGEFSIHCQDVLKKITSYLPAHKNPINFDRRERNERTLALTKRFKQMTKEMRDILSNFKLPQFKRQSDRVGMEISKSDNDSSSTIPTNPTIEEDENEIVVVRTSVLEKVQEAAKRVKDGRWYFLGNHECDYYFGALFKSIFIKVNVDLDTGIVNAFETDLSDTFDKEDMEPILYYNAKVLELKLKKDHLSSVIGAKYDILTFLDYVHMSADEVLKFNGQWVNLEIKYRRSHKLRMTSDHRVIVEVLNAEHVIWWIISLKMLLSNVPGLCEDVTAKTQLGEPVNHDCIKKIARSITPGSQFLYKFMLKLTDFTEKLILRLKYEKEAEGFK